MSPTYLDHLASKAITAPARGFAASADVPWLFPFQRACVEWACRLGRAALFEDTGLGKSRQQLAWSERVVARLRNERLPPRVLIFAPLAVGGQTLREAERIGVSAKIVREQSEVEDGISITNYDILHKFDLSSFGGVVLDESSILKNFMGATKRALVEGCQAIPYRLACTATPAPNDYLELGNHAEFLGVLTSHQMIARWFISDQSAMGTYRLKGHAVTSFWDWVGSWARCVGVPSDIGPFSDDGYVLPPLKIQLQRVDVDIVDGRKDGALFRQPDLSATAIHQEKRRTSVERAAEVARLVAAEPAENWLLWCETDYEAEAVMAVLPEGAVEVHGRLTTEQKSERLLRFAENGGMLLTKPKIGALGLNLQCCARMVFVGGSYSYEAFYQAVRRCWRFGQTRPVIAYVVMASTESAMWHVIHNKSEAHDAMKAAMFAASRRAAARSAAIIDYNPQHVAPIPAWLRSES